MAFEGMDTDALRSVSQQMSSQARALEQVIATIDHLTNQAVAVWDGPDIHDFHNWWATQHRPRLAGLAQELTDSAGRLQQQIVDQEQVSGEQMSGAAAGLSAGGRGNGSGVRLDQPGSGPRQQLKDVHERLEPIDEGLGAAGALTGSATYLFTHRLAGRYPGGTVRGLWQSSSFFHWKTSPTVHGFQNLLEKHPRVARLAPGVAKDLSKIDAFGTGMSVVGAAANGAAVGDDVAKGDWLNAGLDSASAGASVAKSSKNPVAYLGGAAAQAWVEVGKQAQNVDWSADGFKATFDYMWKNPWGAATAGIGADAGYLPGAFGRIFG